MASFQKLKDYGVDPRKLVDFTLHQLEDRPVLQLAPATEDNEAYFNALLKRASRKARVVQASGVSVDIVRENRNEDRELYSKHVIKGWSGVRDDSGEEVPFSEENCLDYLRALPNWIFDRVREFAGSASNFTDDPVEPGELGES